MLHVVRNRRLGTKKDLPLPLGKGRVPSVQREAKRRRLKKLRERKKKKLGV